MFLRENETVLNKYCYRQTVEDFFFIVDMFLVSVLVCVRVMRRVFQSSTLRNESCEYS